MSKRAWMVMDLQYGSTGKGLLAGYLAKRHRPQVVATAWGPNAGHTFVDTDGTTYIHMMLANGIVSPDLAFVLIGPGSVVDLDVLHDEILAAKAMHDRNIHVVIHPQAPIVMNRHRQAEVGHVAIGSTMKGTGAALVDKVNRSPDVMLIARDVFPRVVRQFSDLRERTGGVTTGVHVTVDERAYNHALAWAGDIQIEGAQGFSLGIHRKFWPYCTSREISPHQVLSDLCWPYGTDVEVFGCMRTFPIRVANRFDDKGRKVGTSGPYYSDQIELTWEQVGQPVELTTVTKLPRRVFSFSMEQLMDSVRVCGPDALFLNFCNYVSPGPDEPWSQELRDLCAKIEAYSSVPIHWMGWGPTDSDVRGLPL